MELCIAVGASVDKATLSLLQGYRHQNARIKVTEPLYDGLSAAANRGLALVPGHYVAFLGDIDLSLRQAHFLSLRQLQRIPKLQCLFV